MGHPTDGTLRRLLDEPAGVPDNDREHVAGCSACLSRLAAARQDAAAAGAALDVELAVDVDSAWQRLSHSIAAGGRGRAPSATSADRWRTALRSPAVAALCVVAVLFGAGAVAAADWVQIFQDRANRARRDHPNRPARAAGPLRLRRPRGDPGGRRPQGRGRRRGGGGDRAFGAARERASPRRHRRARAPGGQQSDRGVHVLRRAGGADGRGILRGAAAATPRARRQPVPTERRAWVCSRLVGGARRPRPRRRSCGGAHRVLLGHPVRDGPRLPPVPAGAPRPCRVAAARLLRRRHDAAAARARRAREDIRRRMSTALRPRCSRRETAPSPGWSG